jgi:phosphohistidine phosphatase
MMKPVRTKQAKMKKLIFIRHGKAEDQVADITDFERSLTIRGKSQSKLMAQLLRSHEKDLGLMITSPAFRAIETAIIFGKEFGLSPDTMQISSDLYFNLEPRAYISFFSSRSENTDTITLFGHNFLISEMAAFFAMDETEVLPKSGVLCLTFEAESWSSLKKASGKTEYFLTPKSHL